MSVLVTGGCGFVGSNLVAELLRNGESVIVIDNLSRPGVAVNLEWLRTQGDFEFVYGDVRSSSDLEPVFARRNLVCVFHLAGQVAMTTSRESPRRDFEVNVLGTINVLELVRFHVPEATVVYASSNKVYGELHELALRESVSRYEPLAPGHAIDESARLDFRSPYGCSKGAADQYMLEYARTFGLRTVVFRHSTIYGPRQVSTVDQGWVGWFCQQALLTKRNASHLFTINGNGKQVRDLLYVCDAVACYQTAHAKIATAAGHAFNIGGGWKNSMSLLELFAYLQELLGVTLRYEALPWRNDDQKYFVADNSKAQAVLDWQPTISKEQGIAATVDWKRGRGGGA